MSVDSTASSPARLRHLAAVSFAVGGVLCATDIIVVNWGDVALAAVFGAVPWMLFAVGAAYAIGRGSRAFLILLVALLTVTLTGGVWLAAVAWTHETVGWSVMRSHAFLVGAIIAWLVSYVSSVRLVVRNKLGTVP
jgi:hypothetical protein